MHHDRVLSLSAIAEAASIGPTFVGDELENLTDSDYESDCGLKVPDFHKASGEIDDMQKDSDTEDISHPPVLVRPSGQESLPGTGRTFGEVAGYTDITGARCRKTEPKIATAPKTQSRSKDQNKDKDNSK